MKKINQAKERQLLDFLDYHWRKFGKKPSNKEIAEFTHRLPNSISRQRTTLIERGVIDRERRIIRDER